MADAKWLLNGQPVEEQNLRVVGGQFNAGRASELRLEQLSPVDTPVLAYGTTVSLTKEGSSLAFFRGKITSTPGEASGYGEKRIYVAKDIWDELERTVYQEYWKHKKTDRILVPRAILGVRDDGEPLTTGDQLAEVSKFFGDSLSITAPQGMKLWPSEVRNVSCAEVIRRTVKFHPDWVCSVVYGDVEAMVQDTLVFKDLANLVYGETVSMPISRLMDITVEDHSGRLPDAVRLVFETAETIDDEIYRSIQVQKAPLEAPDSGPGILVSHVDLVGATAEVQKQQVRTRTIPKAVDGAPEDQAAMKAWLEAQFPWFTVDRDHYTVYALELELIEDPDPFPDPVNPNTARMTAETLDDCPRQLIAGTVTEWMRKKVGQVKISFGYAPKAGLATDEELRMLDALPLSVVVTGTDAATKVYRGRTQWVPPEDQVPLGVAAAYLAALQSGCKWSGSISWIDDEIGNPNFPKPGTAINILEADPDWAAMNAPIHTVKWDLETRTVTAEFGPNPELSLDDFLEYIRNTRDRAPFWMSSEERKSPQVGFADGASAQGDDAGPMDQRWEAQEPAADENTLPPFWPTVSKEIDGETVTHKVSFAPGVVTERIPDDGDAVINHEPDNLYTDGKPTRFAVEDGQAAYLVVKVRDTGEVGTDSGSAVEIVIDDDGLESEHWLPSVAGGDGTSGTYRYKLATFAVADSECTVTPVMAGSHVSHWRELPSFVAAGGSFDIFKDYDAASATYRTKGLSAGTGISISDSGDALTISLNPETETGLTCDIIWWDCKISNCSDPTCESCGIYNGYEMILRESFVNGRLVAVDAEIGTGEGQRPLAATVFNKYVMDCDDYCCSFTPPGTPPGGTPA